MMLHSEKQLRVPTMVELDVYPTDITFTKNVGPIECDAFDDDVETKELFGKANFTASALAGFTGEFRGWFSNDEAAIPIYAELTISLGTIDVELEYWKRGPWNPPRFAEQ
jgi:hypothetical protein